MKSEKTKMLRSHYYVMAIIKMTLEMSTRQKHLSLSAPKLQLQLFRTENYNPGMNMLRKEK